MKKSDPKKVVFIDYLKPKNWFVLLLLIIARLIAFFPIKVIQSFGKITGILLYQIPSNRKNVAKKNIELCFPELSKDEQMKLVKDHFICLGMGFFEVFIARWKSEKSIAKVTSIEGLDILQKAVKKNHGVILLSAHFTMLEASAFIGRKSIAPGVPEMIGMYRLGDNSIINRFFRNARLKSVDSLITKFEIKSLIKALKAKKIVWYASDQNFIGKNSIDVNFFGQDAATTPAICRFVEMTDCAVLPYFPKRLENGDYILTVYPEMNNEDCKNPEKFLQHFYDCLESHVLENKEQYYWVHRRFKKQDSQIDPYVNQ